MEFELRPWRESDAESLARYARDPLLSRYLRDRFPCPYTRKDAEDFIRLCIETKGSRLSRCIVVDGQASGDISIIPQEDEHRKSAEMGYCLARPLWGQGIMTRAVGILCREAFARFDLARIYASVYSPNAASARVLEKNGFTLEGVLRNHVWKEETLMDEKFYGLLREECR